MHDEGGPEQVDERPIPLVIGSIDAVSFQDEEERDQINLALEELTAQSLSPDLIYTYVRELFANVGYDLPEIDVHAFTDEQIIGLVLHEQDDPCYFYFACVADELGQDIFAEVVTETELHDLLSETYDA
jgi:hypothetical protein